MAGAFIAKRFVLRLDANVFRLVMDGIMIAAGLSMLANALWSAPTVSYQRMMNFPSWCLSS